MKWTYRLAVLAGVALAWITYLQVRGGAEGSKGASYVTDIQQALSGLKELGNVLQ